MTDPSGVDGQIRSQVEQATLDSQGHFTLDRRHALKKFGSHLLPSPTYWILKVVQAAVAAGSPFVQVTQSGATSEISLQASWSTDQLESALLEPEDGDDSALNHLKRGLWSLATQVDGYVLMPAASGEALSWSAEGLLRVPRSAGEKLVLTVHHDNTDTRWLKAVRQELASRAYTCPIPLTHNGERLDDLSRDTNHSDSHAYQLCVVQLDGLPCLTIPPGTYQLGTATRLGRLRFPPERPQQTSAACVLHLGDEEERRLSLVHWVLDGVIVCSQPLHAKGHGCWCNLYASAAELPLDLGGFRISETTRSAGIAYEISRAFYPALAAIQIDLSDIIRQRRRGNHRARTACLLIGGSVIWAGAAGLGVGLLAGLAAVVTSRDDGGQEEERTLRVSFQELQANWPGAPKS